MSTEPIKADYGIDAPGVIRNLFVIGVLVPALGFVFPVVHIGPVTVLWKSGAVTAGVLCLAEGVLMLLYAKHGKLRHRDRMLARVDWKGDESVLDVGTGRGLLMIGAAKRLSTGKGGNRHLEHQGSVGKRSGEDDAKPHDRRRSRTG